MIELRSHRRRPCCLARYRHGGYSALFPMIRQVTAERKARTGTGPVVLAGEPEKILPFPGKPDAAKRAKPPRGGAGRPKGRPKK